MRKDVEGLSAIFCVAGMFVLWLIGDVLLAIPFFWGSALFMRRAE